MKVKNCTIPDFQQKANEKLNKMKIAQLTELRNLVVLSNIEEEKKGKRPY